MKNKLIAFFLCLFFGWFGVHRFYLKHNKSAFFYLIIDFLIIYTSVKNNIDLLSILLLTLFIWWIADLILIIIGKLSKKFDKIEIIHLEKEEKIEENIEEKKAKIVDFVEPISENNRKYKKYLKLCNQITQSSLISINEKDINGNIIKLHLGKKLYYKKENLDKIRMCRYYEGELQLLFGSKEQATNAFMTVIYLDLVGNYNQLYPDDGNSEWFGGMIAPGIYSMAFKEDLPIEKFEQIFKFNAQNFAKTVNYEMPITPNEAWEKILEYRSQNEQLI